jgi:hypothetical protein
MSIEHVFRMYDRVIFSEDDNVFGASFLAFVNEALNVYDGRRDIFAVAGYNSPAVMPAWYKHDVYLARRCTCWGMGFWKNRFRDVDWSPENFRAMLTKRMNRRAILAEFPEALAQLERIGRSGVIVADGFLLLHLIDKNMYNVMPVRSRVKNTGFDGSGLHCGPDVRYMNQVIYEGTNTGTFPPDVEPDEQLLKNIRAQRRMPLKLRVLLRLRGLIPARIRTKGRRMLRVLNGAISRKRGLG